MELSFIVSMPEAKYFLDIERTIHISIEIESIIIDVLEGNTVEEIE